MAQAKEKFPHEEDFVKAIAGISLFTEKEIEKICKDEIGAWGIFSKKISNSAILLHSSHIFPKFIKHVLRKFIANGYSRVEFRTELIRLSRYDQEGNFVEKLPYAAFTHLLDETFNEIAKEYPAFSVGFIFCLKKSSTPEEIEISLERICNLNWSRAVGIDFAQEEDLYGSIERYNKIVDTVLSRHP
jgi:hypothetical protein